MFWTAIAVMSLALAAAVVVAGVVHSRRVPADPVRRSLLRRHHIGDLAGDAADQKARRLGHRAGGVEGGDGVAAAVLEPVDDVAERAVVQRGGEQGADEDLFAGGVEEGVAAGAVFRFAALHRAWTELAPEPGMALSLWIRDHLDPCLRELLHPSGPFADCAVHERQPAHAVHRPLPTLPTQEP